MQKTRLSQIRKWYLFLGFVGVLLPACGKRNAGAEVQGTVEDSAGNPVAAVRVFNVGDGPQTVETLTDTKGRFRIAGIEPGPIYVFAEKVGYRFAGVRTAAGANDVLIKFSQLSEPIPSRPVAAEPLQREEQKKIAKRLLEKLWTIDARSKRCIGVPLAMSWIDTELALRWANQSESGGADYLRANMAEKIADTDLDEALSMVPEGASRLNLLIKLARRYADSDPEKAMRCAEELAVGGRAFDQPCRTGYLAEAGGLVFHLGKKDAGIKLLHEAGEMAAKLNPSEPAQASARGMAAVAIAPSDVQQALSLIELIPPESGPYRYLANAAVAICRENLDQALDIAKMKAAAYSADSIRLRIAYRLAPTRPADAIRVIETIPAEPHIGGGNVRKAMAFGWIAVAIAPNDKPLACSLIDRAFAILRAPETTDSTIYLGSSVRAAFLAIQAQQIGYPDMESILYRVLACRPPKKKDSSVAVVESQVVMAAFLGLVDPEKAREMLESIESLHKNVGAGPDEVSSEIWVKAWLVVDAKRGEKLFAEELSSIAGKSGTDSQFYDLLEAATMLASTPQEKMRHLVLHPDFCDPEGGN